MQEWFIFFLRSYVAHQDSSQIWNSRLLNRSRRYFMILQYTFQYVSHVLQIKKYRHFFLEEKTLTEKFVTKVCLNSPRTIDYLIKYIKDLKSVWFELSNTLFGC